MAEGPDEAEVSQQFESLQLEPGTSAPDPAEPVEGERRKGTVRWFNASKGFGFIQPEGASGDAEDLFVHQVRACVSLQRKKVIRRPQQLPLSPSRGISPHTASYLTAADHICREARWDGDSAVCKTF